MQRLPVSRQTLLAVSSDTIAPGSVAPHPPRAAARNLQASCARPRVSEPLDDPSRAPQAHASPCLPLSTLLKVWFAPYGAQPVRCLVLTLAFCPRPLALLSRCSPWLDVLVFLHLLEVLLRMRSHLRRCACLDVLGYLPRDPMPQAAPSVPALGDRALRLVGAQGLEEASMLERGPV
eukprot:767896-Hanusia_phi.AAC.2